MVAWFFLMQEVGLSISLQQLKWKWQNWLKQGQHLFEEGYQGVLNGTGSREDIMNSTFIKMKDWILAEHKG